MTTASPPPGQSAAAVWQRVTAQGRLEFMLGLRNGEQLLLTLVIPLAALIGLSHASLADTAGLDTAGRVGRVLPGVLALAVLSTAFTGLAIQTGFERRYGVLKRLETTPLTRLQLLLGKALSVLAIEAGQVLVLCTAAVVMGWRGQGLNVLAAVVVLIIGTATMCALGLALAGIMRAEATLAAANAVYLLLLLVGGIAIPLSRLPDTAANIVQFIPSAALAEGLRWAFGQPTHVAAQVCLGTLVGWFLLGAWVVAKKFRWQ